MAGVTAPWLIPLVYGQRFTPAIPALSGFLPGTIFLVPYQTLMTDFVARGNFRTAINAAAIGLVLNLTLNCLLISLDAWYGGAVGAGLAATFSFVFMGFLLTFAYTQTWKVPLRSLAFPTRADLQAYRRILERIRRQLFARFSQMITL